MGTETESTMPAAMNCKAIRHHHANVNVCAPLKTKPAGR